MSKLFERAYRVTIGTLDIASLDCVFSVKKSLKKQANTCTLKVFNLNPEHRRAIENTPPEGKKGSTQIVRIAAGYKETIGLIYLGTVRTIHTTIEGSDVITSLESGDGEDEIQKSRVFKSFGADTPVKTVLQELVTATGLDKGNLESLIATASARLGSSFAGGTVVAGSAYEELQGICRGAGLEVSVQKGKLLFLDRGKTTATEAYKLSPDSGLIGSPTVDNKGILNCTALLIPDIEPGRRIVLDASHVKGTFRVEETEHVGDTSVSGSEWYVKISAKRL